MFSTLLRRFSRLGGGTGGSQCTIDVSADGDLRGIWGEFADLQAALS